MDNPPRPAPDNAAPALCPLARFLRCKDRGGAALCVDTGTGGGSGPCVPTIKLLLSTSELHTRYDDTRAPISGVRLPALTGLFVS